MSTIRDGIFFRRWLFKAAEKKLVPLGARHGFSEAEVRHGLRVLRIAFALRTVLIVGFLLVTGLGGLLTFFTYLEIRDQTAEARNQNQRLSDQNTTLLQQFAEQLTQNELQRRVDLLRIIYACKDDVENGWCNHPLENNQLRRLAILEFVSLERSRIDKEWREGRIEIPPEGIFHPDERKHKDFLTNLRNDPNWRARLIIPCVIVPRSCVDLHRVNLQDLWLDEADFTGVSFARAIFLRTKMGAVKIAHADFEKAWFVDSRISLRRGDDERFNWRGPGPYFHSTLLTGVTEPFYDRPQTHWKCTVLGEGDFDCTDDPAVWPEADGQIPRPVQQFLADLKRRKDAPK